MPAEPQHYETLGVSPAASDSEILGSFVALIRRYGDHAGETDFAVIDRARQIRIAFDILGDPAKRRVYDEANRIVVDRPAAVGAATEFPSDPAKIHPAASPGVVHDEGSGDPASCTPDGDHAEPAGPRPSHVSRSRVLVSALAGVLALAGVALVFVDKPQRRLDEPAALAQSGSSDTNSTRSTTERAEAPAGAAIASPAGATSVSTAGKAGSQPMVVSTPGRELYAVAGQRSTAVQAQADSPATEADSSPIEADADLASTAKIAPASGSPESDSNGSAPSSGNVPVVVAGAANRPARRISGGLLDSDNPGGELEGTVDVRFTVNREGQASDCRAGGSGNAALRSRTCQLVEDRLRFAPALDAAGQAIPSDIETTYTWGRRSRR